MRRLKSSWTDTLAKLGFKRISRESCEPKCRYRRRLVMEGLEPRQMLAADYTVTTLDDIPINLSDTQWSLREALQAAANDGQSDTDTIEFASNLWGGTMLLTQGQLVVNSNVNIVGPGADKLTIDAHGDSRVITIQSGVDAEIHDMTITGGKVIGGDGGGILVQGVLDLHSTMVADNEALPAAGVGGEGGGIALSAGGSLYVYDTEITGNLGKAGGGIGARLGSGKTLEIRGSTIANNEAIDATGGIHGAGGGAHIFGIHSTTQTDGSVLIVDSTISHNTSQVVGGMYVGNENTSPSRLPISLINSTVAFNEGAHQVESNSSKAGGISINNKVEANFLNTIIAGNTRADLPGVADDIYLTTDSLNSFSHTLIGYANPSSGIVNGQQGNKVEGSDQFNPLNPRLAPLGDFGGFTRTHALLPGSPAIDAGNNAHVPTGTTKDQRGFTRIVDQPPTGPTGKTVDIGATEFAKLIAPVADFNGDGRDDHATIDTNGNVSVVLGGAGISQYGVWGNISSIGTSPSYFVGDFNGDGRDDIAARGSSGLKFAISQGTAFLVHNAVDQSGAQLNFPSSEIYVGDFDGDGSDELLGWNSSAAKWQVLHYDEQTHSKLDDNWGTQIHGLIGSGVLHVGDANRDGRDDLVVRNSTGNWYVALSQATGGGTFGAQFNWGQWFTPYANAAGSVVDIDAPYQKVLDIFSEVRNTVELEFYPGLMKGIQATAETKAGNPWDQAALLVDRLEDAGFDADIATGVIEVPMEELLKWLGMEGESINTLVVMFQIITRAFDRNAIPVDDNGDDVRNPLDPENEQSYIASYATAIRFRHAWVRVMVPTASGLTPVDIDPSWKFKDHQQGIQIDLSQAVAGYSPPSFGIAGRSTRGTFDELGLLANIGENQLPLEWYEDQLMHYLQSTGQSASLADIAFDGPIKQEQFHRMSEAGGTYQWLVGNVSQYENVAEIFANPTLTAQLSHRLTISTSTLDRGETAVPISINSLQQLQPYLGIEPSDVTVVPLTSSTVSSFGMGEGDAEEQNITSVETYYIPMGVPVVGDVIDLRTTAAFPQYSLVYLPSPMMDGFGSFIASDYTNNLSTPAAGELKFSKAGGFAIDLTSDYEFTEHTTLDFQIKQTANSGASYNPTFVVGIALYSDDPTPLPLSYRYFLVDGQDYEDYDDSHAVGVIPGGSFIPVSIPVGHFWADTPGQYSTRIHILHADNVIRGLRESGNGSAQNAAGTTTIKDLLLKEHSGEHQIIQVGSTPDWELELTGSAHVSADINYVVTPNTVIEFDFRSTEEGLYHFIGVDTDTTANNDPTRQILWPLFGTEISLPSGSYQGYDGSGQTRRLVIPIGQELDSAWQSSGLNVDHLVFVSQDEPGGDAQSVFSHIRMYELEPFDFTFDNNELRLSNYSYVKADADYTLTNDTVIQFDFRSTDKGDKHIIGWDKDGEPGTSSGSNSSQLIAFYGHDVSSNLYSGTSWKTLQIPVDPYFSGTSSVNLDSLVFGVDDGPNGSANSHFRNVKLFEEEMDLVSGGYQFSGEVLKRLPFDYTITPNTYLECDFRSLDEGNFQGIGWDTNDVFSSSASGNQYFWLTGDDNAFGNIIVASTIQDDLGTGQLYRVRLNIGDYLVNGQSASMKNLVFLNDGGTSLFSNIEIGEEIVPAAQLWSETLIVPKPTSGLAADEIRIGYERQETGGNISFFPYLEVNGSVTDIALGSMPSYPGENIYIETNHLYPALFAKPGTSLDFSVQYLREVGQVHAIVLDANQHSDEYLSAMQSALVTQQAEMLQRRLDGSSISETEVVHSIQDLLGFVGTKYWDSFDRSNHNIDDYLHTIGIQHRVGSGVITADPVLISDQPITHLSYANIPENLGVDLLNLVHSGLDARGIELNYSPEVMQLFGLNASALENAAIEEVANTASISMMRGLERAYRGELGITANGSLVDREAVQVFESVPNTSGGRTIYFRGEIGVNAQIPYDPNGTTTRTRAQLLNTSTGELRNLVRPGSSINESDASYIVDVLEDAAGETSGVTRVFVPRSRSKLGEWTGTVYFMEYTVINSGYHGKYSISPDNGPVMNGAYGSGIFRPENTNLSKGTFLNQTFAGDPVNVANGNMFRDEADFQFANRKMALDFGRHYDSQNNMDVGFGVGWTHSFTGLLFRAPGSTDDNKIVWLRGDGQRHTFERPNASAEYKVPASLHGTFETRRSGSTITSYVYRDQDGMQYEFDAIAFDHSGIDGRVVGRMYSMGNRLGDIVYLGYESNSSVRPVIAIDGLNFTQKLDFAYFPTYTEVKRTAAGQLLDKWTYFFTTVADDGPGHTTKRLAGVISPTDSHVSTPAVTLYYYYTDGPTARRGLIREITEPNGESHSYEYYANGRVFRVTDGEGHQQTFSYNLFRNLTEFTDERGNVETYLHQDNGLLERQIHPDRSRLKFTWGGEGTPEEFLMKSSTDEIGATETFTYYQPSDPNYRPGELKQSVSKDNITTNYEYWVSPVNAFRHISELSKITVVDPNGPVLITQFTDRDEQGQLKRSIDPAGNVTTREYFLYDTLTPAHLRGRLKSETQPKGVQGGEAVTWQPISNSFTVTGDTLSVRLLTSSDPATHVGADAIRIDRIDDNGVFTRIVDDDITGNDPHFRFHLPAPYLPFDPVQGTQAEYGGDSIALRGSATGQGSATWFFTDLLPGTYRISALWIFDPLNNVPNATYQFFDGQPDAIPDQTGTANHGAAPTGFRSYQTVFSYDTAGNVISAVTEGLPSGTQSYDSRGNVVSAVDATGAVTNYVYDVLGRLVRSSVSSAASPGLPAVSTTVYQYDPSGRLLTSNDALGQATAYGYDAKGKLTKETYADGTSVQYEYDQFGNQVSATNELGQTTHFVYDSRNRLIQTIYADGTSTQQQYEGAGRVFVAIDELGRVTRFTYDKAGRQLTSSHTLTFPGTTSSNITTTNTYDALGRLTQTSDSNDNKTVYEYDLLGRVVETRVLDNGSTSLPPVFLSTTKYDANGNVAEQVVYDVPGLMRPISEGGAGLSSIPADPTPLITSQPNFVQRVKTTYDAFGRTAKVTQADGTTSSIVYDAAGRVRYSFDELGRRTELQYDEFGRLERTIAPDPDGSGPQESAATRYERDALGNVIRDWQYFGTYQGATGVEHADRYFYDARNRLVATFMKDDAHRTDMLYDAAGRRIATTDALGNTSYTLLDERGRVLKQRLPDPDGTGKQFSPVTTYAYDAVGNVTLTQDALGQETLLSYDSLNRLREERILDTRIADDAGAGDSSFSFTQAPNYIEGVTAQIVGRDMTIWGSSPSAPTASWTFNDVAAGQYRVSMNWLANPAFDSAAQVKISINGQAPVATVTLDQTKSGSLRGVHGEYVLPWTEVLSNLSVPAGATLTVQLVGHAGTPLIADAVRIDRYVSRNYTYDNNGNLLSDTDTLGRTTNYAYDELSRQTLITLPDPDGANPLGRPETRSSYDGYGNLIERVDTRGTTPTPTSDDRSDTFEYDQRNRLVTETLDVGTGHENVTTTYEYDAVGNRTLVTDALGFQTHYRYDAAGRLIDEYRDFGEGRDEAAPLTINPATVQPYSTGLDGSLGIASTFAVSPDGLSLTMGGNAWKSIPVNYTVKHNTVLELEFQSERDAQFYIVGFETDNTFLNGNGEHYFELGGLLSAAIFDPEFRRETLADGAVCFHIPIGQKLSFAELGATSLAISRLVFGHHDTRAGVSSAERGSATFSNIRLYDSDEVRTVYTYDTRGNLETARDASDPRNITTRYRYDLIGQQSHEILDDGGVLQRTFTTSYDAVGNVLVERNASAQTETRYEYDQLYRLIKTTLPDPDGVPGGGTGFASEVTTFVYDVLGNLIRETNGEFESRYSDYDPQGRLVAERDGNGDETRYRYDSEGNLRAVTDAEQNTTKYQYDALDRVTTETNALDLSRTYVYEKQGNIAKVTDRNGRVREFTYDALDRRVTENWKNTSAGSVVHTLAWQYDGLGRVTRQADGSVVNAFGYDGLGRLIEETNYDPTTAAGSSPQPEIRTTYEYFFQTPSDNLTFYERSHRFQTERTAGGDVPIGYTQYQSDRLGRLQQYEDRDLATALGPVVETKFQQFSYDVAGNLDEIKWYGNHNGSIWQNTAHSDLQYDKANRLTRMDHYLDSAPPSVGIHSYAYDNASRVTSFNTASVVDTNRGFTYDDAGQLTGATGSASESYTYDTNGNRVTAGGQTVVSGPANRVTNDGTYTYQYDNEGNLTRRTEISTGLATVYTWDHRNRLTSVATVPAVAATYDFSTLTLSSYQNSGGPAVVQDGGATLQLTNNAWRAALVPATTVGVDTYLEFDYYRTGEGELHVIGLDTDTSSTNGRYYYQMAGVDIDTNNTLQIEPLADLGGNWSHFRIRLSDLATLPIGYTFTRLVFANDDDGDGSLTSQSRFRNVTLRQPGQASTEAVDYTYDAAGQRVVRTAGATGSASASEYFVYESGLGAGSQLAMTFDDGQELTHRYLYGPAGQVLMDEVFAEEAGNLVTDEVLWLISDQQGTVRDVWDDNGTFRKALQYDSFGNVTDEDFFDESGAPIAATHAEAVDQLFFYTGQEKDETTGLQLHGKRWYDPKLARFSSEDPIGFDAGDPNLYRYVGNSPYNFTDPSGTRQAGNPLDNLFGSLAPSLSSFNFSTSRTPSLTTNPFSSLAPLATSPSRNVSGPNFDQATFDALFPIHSNDFNARALAPTYREVESARQSAALNDITRRITTMELGAMRSVNDPVIAAAQNPRVQGAARIAGSFVEYAAAVTIAGGSGGSAVPVSLVVAANATDNLITGYNQFVTGIPQKSLKYRALEAVGGPDVANYGEPIVDSAVTLGAGGFTQLRPRPVSLSVSPSGIRFVDEAQTKYGYSQLYEDATTGARSNVSSGLRQVPALDRRLPNGTTTQVKFDGIDGGVLIDRKVSVTTFQKSKDQAIRQAEALRQNGLTGRWEVPNQSQASRADKLLHDLRINNIEVRIVP